MRRKWKKERPVCNEKKKRNYSLQASEENGDQERPGSNKMGEKKATKTILGKVTLKNQFLDNTGDGKVLLGGITQQERK